MMLADQSLVKQILQVRAVRKTYGRVPALDGVSFDVASGESIALWGANGAGKTTLIRAILGLIDYQGQILIDGLDTRRQGKASRSLIGYVPQEAIYYDMSVLFTLGFYARIKKVPAARIPPLLESLGLSDHTRKPVPALSGGLKQRLALAVALLSDPPILLLDEPTANLDAKGRRDYLRLLVDLRKQNKTVLFASHRIEEVETLSQRVILLDSGRVVEEVTPQDLRRRLAPDVEITFWMADDQHQKALDLLLGGGMQAHLNGRGTVVVQVHAAEKLIPLTRLSEAGIQIQDFEMENVQSWS